MKKLIMLLLASAMVMGMAGCSKTQTEEPTATPDVEVTEDTNLEDGAQGEVVVADTAMGRALNKVLSENVDEMPPLMLVNGDELADLVGITSDMVTDFVFGTPLMMVHSTTIAAFEVVEGQMETVKELVNTYMLGLEDQWANYLPDQYELVQNRSEFTVGNYYMVIVGENADQIQEVFFQALETELGE